MVADEPGTGVDGPGKDRFGAGAPAEREELAPDMTAPFACEGESYAANTQESV